MPKTNSQIQQDQKKNVLQIAYLEDTDSFIPSAQQWNPYRAEK